MKTYLKHLALVGLCCLFVICENAPVTRAEIASEQLQGGDSKENAVEIQLNHTYEAIVPLTEKNGKYSGESWYKFSIPQYAHKFALVVSSSNYRDSNFIDIDNAKWCDHDCKVEIDDQHTEYFEAQDGCSVYYVRAFSKSPETLKFKVVPVIYTTPEDNVTLNFNQEYKEIFYTNSSCYSVTAPYTGKYRIYYKKLA